MSGRFSILEALAVLGVALLSVAPPTRAAENSFGSSVSRSTFEYALEGEEFITSRSGSSGGAEVRIALPGGRAVKTVTVNERSDKPCWVLVWGRHVNEISNTEVAYHSDCDGSTGQNDMEVGWPSAESLVFISGVSVCLNRDRDRIKGLAVVGALLEEDGSTGRPEMQPRESLNNCDEWQSWASCPADHVATGIIAAYSTGDRPRSIRGIKLICRRVVVRSTGDAQVHLTGPVVETDLAGLSTNHEVVLKPGNSNEFGLDTIRWGEKKDHPCWAEVEGRDLNHRDQRSRVDQLDECDGKGRDKSTLEATVRRENENAFMVGLSVCINNERLKGISTEFTVPVAESDGNPPPPDNGAGSSASQVNCLLAWWSDSVRCPARHVAIGVKFYLFRNEDPHSIRGARLLCRAYQ